MISLKWIFLVGFISSSINAEEFDIEEFLSITDLNVSSFTLSEIKLGDDYTKVKEKLHSLCNRKLNFNTNFLDNKKLGYHQIICFNPDVYTRFNQYNKLISVSKSINFSYKPNWNKIKSNLIKVYGNHTDGKKRFSNSRHDCSSGKVTIENMFWSTHPPKLAPFTSAWLDTSWYTGRGLESVGHGLELEVDMRSDECENKHYISLTLRDYPAIENLEQWKEEKNKEYRDNRDSSLKF